MRQDHPKRRPQNKPAEGTKLRAVYDLLHANPGKPVTLPPMRQYQRGDVIRQLRDLYGVNIQTLRSGKAAPAAYKLVPE